MLMGIRRDLIEKGKEINVEDGGVVVGKVRRESEKRRIIGVYVSKGMEYEKQLGKMGRQKEEGNDFNRGDFNARTGKKGEGCEGEEGGRMGEIYGCTRGDEEGEYSFTGRKGNSVIDYAIGDLEVRERIESMRIGDRVQTITRWSLEEQWREMAQRIKETLEEVESKRDEGNRKKVEWWDEDCKED
ncbi:hypothetical protein EAG_01266 [Camponotus floridanus]|uniref:Uncharacterized protein n=1 Tax=Camponotus floridanus TaxID=104421 RepID=E2ACX4_CAMFO|nr:hypothetical protein EAG_01266 [Camponotus floridanus]